mmetsp:Transcript_19192/g.31951  ORF Transcript_19192/g.31951 Transcript_19192/m.31951 type:complete len:94 (-) Transcript_19192:338-619(-)
MIIFFICGLVSIVWGYIEQSFDVTFHGWVVGLVLSLLICVPDWPFFNKNAVAWVGKPTVAKTPVSPSQVAKTEPQTDQVKARIRSAQKRTKKN